MNWDANEYFKTEIAEKHKDIAHTEEAPAFFREYSTSKILFDNSDFLSKLRYAKNIALISQFNGEGLLTGANDDSLFYKNTGVIYILKKVFDGNIGAARDKTKEIFKQIIAKMRLDMNPEIRKVPHFFELNNIQIVPVGMIADKYYGLAAFMTFAEPECTEIDADVWLP